jgi:hypothetical protein
MNIHISSEARNLEVCQGDVTAENIRQSPVAAEFHHKIPLQIRYYQQYSRL